MASELRADVEVGGVPSVPKSNLTDDPVAVATQSEPTVVHGSGGSTDKPRLNLSRRISELDGLRGLAIGMVVFIHEIWFPIGLTPPPGPLRYLHALGRPMWSAVDLFFILSGLLIGGNLLDVRDSPRFFSTFYIRRFCRVLPIYFLSLAVDWLIYHFIVRGPNVFVVGWAFAPVLPWYSYLLFAQNLWMAKWATMGSLGLAMTWAFAVELQFYLVIPAVIRYVRRSALPYIFVSGMVIAPLARLYLVHRSLHNLVATYVLLPCRMDSLCLGLLCAYYLRDPHAWNWFVDHRKAVWAVWCGLLAGIPLVNTEGLPFTLLWITVGYGWMAVFWAATLILGVIGPKGALSRVLSWKGFTRLGIISYGVYLFHIMAYALCMWRSESSGHLLVSWRDLGITLISLAITIGFATLSWRYFEKPILKWGHGWHY